MPKFKPRSIRLDQRHWLLGVSSALKWMKKPVSEQGATQVARFTIGLQGPHLLREVELLRNHPVDVVPESWRGDICRLDRPTRAVTLIVGL